MRPLAALAVLLAWAAAPAGAAEKSPDPAELLGRATASPAVAYYGKMLEVQWYGKRTRAEEIQIFYKPPASRRREILAHGSDVPEVAVSDGQVEWIIFPGRKRAFKGEASRSDLKQTEPEVQRELLLRNYRPRVRGAEEIAGRKAWVLELAALGPGKPRQTLWIDQATGLILRTKRYHADGSLASRSGFEHLVIPAEIPDEMFSYEPPDGFKVEDHGFSPQYLSLQDLKDAVASPPQAPQELPGGFVFESAGVVPVRGRSIVHLRYSDGLLLVSLFDCPVAVRAKDLAVARGEGLAPGEAFLEWRSGRHHFVLMGDVSAGLLRRMQAQFSKGT